MHGSTIDNIGVFYITCILIHEWGYRFKILNSLEVNILLLVLIGGLDYDNMKMY